MPELDGGRQDHLRSSAQGRAASAESSPSGGDLEAGQKLGETKLRAHLPEQLRGPRRPWRPTRPWPRSRATRRPSGPPRRLRSACATRWPGTRLAARERARHHAVRGRRLRRQEPQPAGDRGRAPGQGRRQAGAGVLDPRGGVFLRHVPARRPSSRSSPASTSRARSTFWDYEVYYAGDRGAAQFYNIPNHRTATHGGGWQGPPGSILSAPAPGARPATTPTPSPASRRST